MSGVLWPDGRHLTSREVDLLIAWVESHPGSTLTVEVVR